MTHAEITQLLTSGYQQSAWKNFLKNLFPRTIFKLSPEILDNTNFAHIGSASHLGYIQLNENGIERNIGIYEVKLDEGVVLERNRVGLRNLLRKYWQNLDGAFVVYYQESSKIWRFTWVSELTGFNASGEYVNVKTDPKRYTYIFGEGETCKTAAERFLTLEKKGGNISTDDITEAFSVEKLSKSFFDSYKKLYEEFCEYLKKSRSIFQPVFNGDEKEIRDFTKLLLGRITFIYFIQKKGWLGVPVDGRWGEGDSQFLWNLYQKYDLKSLFYKNVLTKLFFDTLNTQRENDLIELIGGERVKIPFLNGGLFEEENVKYREIVFDELLFDKLFAFFNQYNFTIYEDDPTDHTVAVDPEMLGHIFENLLEDNKDKGAFYTPKEIVHYMCQESLIEYLTTWFENKGYEVLGYASFKDLETPQLFSGNEHTTGQMEFELPVLDEQKKIDRVVIEKLLKKALDENDRKLISQHIDEFTLALDSVKICDPAIGSGAFPMGLLQEIFSAKQTLWFFKHGNLNDFPASEIKLNIIQNSIYGVDIEKGAVDIARLRFWLSLVVDEIEPKALPNLDYKIVVGNSLVSKFGDEIIDIDWNIDETAHGIFGANLEIQKGELLKRISEEQKEFFYSGSDKKKLAAEIRNLKIDLLITQLELMIEKKGDVAKPETTGKKATEQMNRYLQAQGWKASVKELKQLKQNPEKPLHFFDWKLDFPEILNPLINKNPGFDIVIANPPYIDSETMVNTGQEELRSYLTLRMPFCKGNWDIYIAFFNLSFNLLNRCGNLSFITPDKWISKPFGEGLRIGLINHFKSIAEAGRNVFENAKVDSIITFVTNKHQKWIRTDKFIDGKSVFFSNIDKKSLTEPYAFDWLFSDFVGIIEKLESMPNRLMDYGLCENACATADAYKIKEYIFESEFDPTKHLKIINTGTVGKYISKWGIREMTYLKDKYLQPVVDRDSFIYAFNNSYGSKSLLPKIIIKGLTLLDGCLDREGFIIPGKSTLVITQSDADPNRLFLPLAIINSKISIFYIKEKYRGSSYNQGINFNPEMLNHIPLPQFSKSLRRDIELKVETILKNSLIGEKTIQIEEEINLLLFRLYDLTYDEVKIIDPEFPLTEEEYKKIELE